MKNATEEVRRNIKIGFSIAILIDKEEDYEKMLFEELESIRKFRKEYGGNEDD